MDEISLHWKSHPICMRQDREVIFFNIIIIYIYIFNLHLRYTLSTMVIEAMS